jgi:hypothetical protein
MKVVRINKMNNKSALGSLYHQMYQLGVWDVLYYSESDIDIYKSILN